MSADDHAHCYPPPNTFVDIYHRVLAAPLAIDQAGDSISEVGFEDYLSSDFANPHQASMALLGRLSVTMEVLSLALHETTKATMEILLHDLALAEGHHHDE